MPKQSYFVKRSGLIWLLLSVIVIALDQVSKCLVSQHMMPGEVIRLAPFFNIQLAFNTGSAYGFLGQMSGWQMPLFAAIAIIVSLVFIVWLARIQRSSYLLCIAFSLIIGGAIGNMIDRLHQGYVIDFFDFHLGTWHFATFNVADSAITIGAVLLIVKFIFSPSSS